MLRDDQWERLILDELGYLPLSHEEASLFFRLLVRCYERGSLIVTSNKSFADRGEIFNDHVLATAILDRLLHHATTLNIKKAGLLDRRPGAPAEEVTVDASAWTNSLAKRGHLKSVICGQPTSVLTGAPWRTCSCPMASCSTTCWSKKATRGGSGGMSLKMRR